MPGFWQNLNIDDQKVQEADEIKRDIWKYLVSSDVVDDAWYNDMCNISPCAKWIPSYSFYMPGIWQKMIFDDQKVQVVDEIRYIDNQK